MSGFRAFKMRLGFGRKPARTITVNHDEDPESVRARLRLPVYDHLIQMIAGAALSTDDMMARIEPVFRTQIAPYLSRHAIPIIDGATQSGFVGMMGRARHDSGGTFPLIGIAPLQNIQLPNTPPSETRFPLETNHTHFALVKGGEFGVESEMIVGLGKAISKRRVALVINGGEIARKEARMNARVGNPLLVLEGSGRVADELIEALKRGTSNDVLRETIEIGIVRTCTADTILAELKDLLGLKD